ncbi:predicted protein [Verticillium alfalfae VaMs.102]|uniref:Predicted protein n=1 Tax=Verticillium alfalfae (strain VaMs.102 / ATCC MYA-4576 / FGSC 10136) TaxID=526221 RepID=C9SRI3_VERA1|nr:predicted protein [Verticillium alfalfae VaMs.102]EEY21398.1 predicted protein [Verticillium alfalfae VaMs.102]
MLARLATTLASLPSVPTTWASVRQEAHNHQPDSFRRSSLDLIRPLLSDRAPREPITEYPPVTRSNSINPFGTTRPRSSALGAQERRITGAQDHRSAGPQGHTGPNTQVHSAWFPGPHADGFVGPMAAAGDMQPDGDPAPPVPSAVQKKPLE